MDLSGLIRRPILPIGRAGGRRRLPGDRQRLGNALRAVGMALAFDDIADGENVLARLAARLEILAGTHGDERGRLEVDPVMAVAGLTRHDPLAVLLDDPGPLRDCET